MLYGLKLSGGDLVMRGDGQLETVSGKKRIEQDLICYTLEPVGTDRMYPRFGSTIPSYIGAISSEDNHSAMRAEVTRIVNLYMADQSNRIQTASEYEIQNVWTMDEIVAAISAIKVLPDVTNARILVELETMEGSSATIPILE